MCISMRDHTFVRMYVRMSVATRYEGAIMFGSYFNSHLSYYNNRNDNTVNSGNTTFFLQYNYEFKIII